MSAARRLSIGQATVLSMTVDALITAATVVSVPLLVHRLGVEAYGLVGLVGVLTGQLALLQNGTGPATTRRVAEHWGRADRDGAYEVLQASTIIGLATALLVGAAFWWLGPWALVRSGKSSAPLLSAALGAVAPGAASAAIQSLHMTPLSFLLGQQRFAVLSLLRLTHGLGRMLAALAAVGLGGGVPALLWAQVAVDAGALAAASFATRDPGSRRVPLREILGRVQDVARLGAPFTLMSAIMGLLGDAEKIVIAAVKTLEDFTYYAIPHNATVRLSSVTGALAGNMVPRLAFEGTAWGDVPVAALTRRATRVALGLVSLFLCPLIAILPELLAFWLGGEFARHAAVPARILLLVLLVSTAGNAANAALRARARPSVLALIYGVQLPLYAALLYFMVRGWGIRGAAGAFLVRSLFDLACQRFAASRSLRARLGGLPEIGATLGSVAAFLLGCELLGPHLGPAPRLAIGTGLGGLIAARLLSAQDWAALLDAALPWRWVRRASGADAT